MSIRHFAELRERERRRKEEEEFQAAIMNYQGYPCVKATTVRKQLLYKDILLSSFLRMRYKDSSWKHGDSSYTRWAEINAKRTYFPEEYTFKVILKTNEFYNNGGNSNYVKVKVLSVVVNIISKLTQNIHYLYQSGYGKEFDSSVINENFECVFFPRNASVEKDILFLDGQSIKDAVLRFGFNKKRGVFSENGKVISVILEDGTLYELNGDKLPWHRFGDYSIDYGERDPDGRSEFEEMEEQVDGTYIAKYTYKDYERGDPYEDYYDDWKEMAEDGAQFSWID